MKRNIFIVLLCLTTFFSTCSVTADTPKGVMYSSDYKLIGQNACEYGIKLIDNKIYVPMQNLPFFCNYIYEDTPSPYYSLDFTYPIYNGYNEEKDVYVSRSYDSKIYGGKYIGIAEPNNVKIEVISYSLDNPNDTIKDFYDETIYTLSGKYPMISLDFIKKFFPNTTIDYSTKIINLGLSNSGYTEDDTVAEAMKKFYINDASETNRAMGIHNFVVKNMFYGYHCVKAEDSGLAFFTSDYVWVPRNDNVAKKVEDSLKKYTIRENQILCAGTGLCEDYERLYQHMCDIAGIPNLKCIGGDHTWNVIFVNNKWQVVDCTWDDKSYQEGDQSVAFDYFLLDEDKHDYFDDSPYYYVYYHFLD